MSLEQHIHGEYGSRSEWQGDLHPSMWGARAPKPVNITKHLVLQVEIKKQKRYLLMLLCLTTVSYGHRQELPGNLFGSQIGPQIAKISQKTSSGPLLCQKNRKKNNFPKRVYLVHKFVFWTWIQFQSRGYAWNLILKIKNILCIFAGRGCHVVNFFSSKI